MPVPQPSRTAAWRPIFDACFAGDYEILEQMLAAGADPNQVARSGWRQRPLHRVCEFRISHPKHGGHARCIQILLNAGADPTLRANSTNMRPLELAAIAGMADAVGILKRTPVDLFQAAASGDVQWTSQILADNPALAVTHDEAGCTALWYSAASRLRANQVSVAELLLNAGADPNAYGLKVPILHMATAHARSYELAEYLLCRGADLHVNTSLVHSACSFHFQHLMEALSWFRAHEADFTLRDPETNQTAREKAEFLRYHRVARWLAS